MMSAIIRILALTRKELLAVLKDPRGRFSLFFPPILQCLIYGYAATYDLNHVPYVLVDQDHSAASRDLVARLDGSGVFQCAARLDSANQIKPWIDRQNALLAIQIGPNFQRHLSLGQKADIQVIADGRNSNTAGTAAGYVNAVVEQFNAQWSVDHSQSAPAIQTLQRAWYNPNLETRWHMIPSLIGTLTLLQTLLLTAMSVAREREQGTFDQLLVTPYRPFEIMAGKSIPSILIGLVQATNVLLVAQLWFHIPFAGSFVVLYGGLLLFLLAAVGIGLLISAISANMQQAMLYSFVVMMPFALLSGLTTPLSSMPPALQYATLMNPLRYAIDIAQRVYLQGATPAQLSGDIWPLAIQALVSLTAASWMFRHRLE
jgi:ABC-2 type transport system permease protein